MRLFLVVSLVMSFSAWAQNSRVRENIKQSSISASEQPEKKQIKIKKSSQKVSSEKKRAQ